MTHERKVFNFKLALGYKIVYICILGELLMVAVNLKDTLKLAMHQHFRRLLQYNI